MNERPEVPPDPEAGTTLPAPWRAALIALGFVLTAVGIAGLVLPLLPGTVFLILAAACFARSSPRLEAWVTSHPRLGPPVRAWRRTGAIPARAKAAAVGGMTLSWILLWPAGAPGLVKALCLVIFVTVAAYIGSRPES
jgi:uncharacterized membrane protein YbaN (DUF454 family)